MEVRFEWDDANNVKNYTKHGVSCEEAESVFQDVSRFDYHDPLRPQTEKRYVTLGRSNRPRILLIAWTLRGEYVRVISARPASRRERKIYEEKNKKRE